jgi:hypothetical protein
MDMRNDTEHPRVAEQAVQQVRRYLVAGVPVGENLADQLLLPLALAGTGSFLTHSPTRHTKTSIEHGLFQTGQPLSIGRLVTGQFDRPRHGNRLLGNQSFIIR